MFRGGSNRNGTVAEADLAALGAPDLPAAIVRVAMAALERQGLIVKKRDRISESSLQAYARAVSITDRPVEGPSYWELTEAGFDQWAQSNYTEELEDSESVDYDERDDSEIPAANRFVARNDNRNKIDLAIAALGELDEAVAGANGLTDDDEETAAIRTEVTGYRAWLSLPKIRIAAIGTITRGVNTLRSLARKVGATLVEKAADRVVAILIDLLPKP